MQGLKFSVWFAIGDDRGGRSGMSINTQKAPVVAGTPFKTVFQQIT
jgi:hypothetical protein